MKISKYYMIIISATIPESFMINLLIIMVLMSGTKRYSENHPYLIDP